MATAAHFFSPASQRLKGFHHFTANKFMTFGSPVKENLNRVYTLHYRLKLVRQARLGPLAFSPRSHNSIDLFTPTPCFQIFPASQSMREWMQQRMTFEYFHLYVSFSLDHCFVFLLFLLSF